MKNETKQEITPKESLAFIQKMSLIVMLVFLLFSGLGILFCKIEYSSETIWTLHSILITLELFGWYFQALFCFVAFVLQIANIISYFKTEKENRGRPIIYFILFLLMTALNFLMLYDFFDCAF